MTGKHRTIGNSNILTRHSQAAGLCVSSRFNRNAVITYRNMAITDMYIPAGLRIDSIRVGRRDIIYRDSFDSHIVTKLRINSPKRRIDNFHSFNLHLLATNRLNERRAEKTTLQSADIILIRLCIDGSRIILSIPHRLIFINITHTIIFQVNHYTKELHPPLLTLTIQCTFSLDSDIFRINRID